MRLQEILYRQTEIQKRQLQRLVSRGSPDRRDHSGGHAGSMEHSRDWSEVGWHHPVSYDWTRSYPDAHHHHGVAAAVGTDYQRTVSHECK